MPIEYIHDLHDPRLAPYRSLKQSNLTRWSGLFIAEGEKVVRRLLTSQYATRSVLLSERKSHIADGPEFAGQQVFVLPQSLAEELVGFNFHAGVLACGERPRETTHKSLIVPPPRSVQTQVAVVCSRTTDPDNLGTIIRLCAAFGAGPLVLGPGSVDPLSRRTLRVSMGYALHVPLMESENLLLDLGRLKKEGYLIVATVLDETAVQLKQITSRNHRVALLFGNEADGLDRECIDQADMRATIPMSGGADSLNVALSVGIFLHHFCRVVE